MKRGIFVIVGRNWRSLGAAVVALALAGCESVPQAAAPRQVSPASATWAERKGDVIEHIPSGMQFPSQVADFKRDQPRVYDAEGLNVSAGYNSAEGVTITVYVYPIEPYGGATPGQFSAKAHFNEARDQIAKVRSAMKTITEQDVPPPRGAVSGSGHFGRYEFLAPYGGRSQQLESLLYVYAPVGERWIVKYRMTYPKDSLEARSAVGRFVESFAWNLRRGP